MNAIKLRIQKSEIHCCAQDDKWEWQEKMGGVGGQMRMGGM